MTTLVGYGVLQRSQLNLGADRLGRRRNWNISDFSASDKFLKHQKCRHVRTCFTRAC